MSSKLLSFVLESYIEKNPALFKMLRNLGFYDCDIPLDKTEDSRFLILLIALMSFLAVIAFSGVFALNNMTARWSSGLENKVTIEIGVETQDGHLLSNKTVQRETQKLAKGLKGHPAVKSISILSAEEVQELISPWIGEGLVLNDIPLPGLIAIELKKTDTASLKQLEQDIAQISEYAMLETHREWLADLIAFAGTLKTLSLVVALIIAGATVTAITAGIRTRMSIHKREVELLHSIGASDHYIARQFQHHALLLAIKGSLIGTVAGLIMVGTIVFMSSYSTTSLIPTIKMTTASVLLLCVTPLIVCLIATLTSRFTVLRRLVKMP